MSQRIKGSGKFMVDVAQLVEPRTVTLVVVGSNPIVHPMFRFLFRVNLLFLSFLHTIRDVSCRYRSPLLSQPIKVPRYP